MKRNILLYDHQQQIIFAWYLQHNKATPFVFVCDVALFVRCRQDSLLHVARILLLEIPTVCTAFWTLAYCLDRRKAGG